MGLGDLFKGAAGAVGDVVGAGSRGVSRVATGAASSFMDLATGAENASRGPLHPQGPQPTGHAPQSISQAVVEGQRQNIPRIAREEGRTPHEAYREIAENPRVQNFVSGAGRVGGTAISRTVDPTGALQNRVFGRDVIAGAGEEVAKSVYNQAVVSPAYISDPTVIHGAVEKTGQGIELAAEHPEVIIPAVKAGAKSELKKLARPETAIAFAAELAIGGVAGAAGRKFRTEAFKEAEEIGMRKLAGTAGKEIAEEAVESGAARTATRSAEQLIAPAVTTGRRSAGANLQRVLQAGTSEDWNPISSKTAEMRSGRAEQFLAGRQNPTSGINQKVASMIQGHSGAKPRPVAGMTAETMAAQEAKNIASQGALMKGRLAAAPAYIHATAHPGAFAAEEAQQFAGEHKEDIAQAASKRAAGMSDDALGRIRADLNQPLQDIQGQLPEGAQGKLDDLQAQAEAKADELKGKAEDEVTEEEPQRPNTNLYETMPGGQAVTAQTQRANWPSPTVSDNGVPAPEGMEQTIKSQAGTTGKASLGRRGSAFQRGYVDRPGRQSMHAWQGPNREALGGISPDFDWRPFKQRPIGEGNTGYRRFGGEGEEEVAVEAEGETKPEPRTPQRPQPLEPAGVPATPINPQPMKSAAAEMSPMMEKATDVTTPLVAPGVRFTNENDGDNSRKGAFDGTAATYTHGVVQGVDGGMTSNAYDPTTNLAGTYTGAPKGGSVTTAPAGQADPLNAVEAAPVRPSTPAITFPGATPALRNRRSNFYGAQQTAGVP